MTANKIGFIGTGIMGSRMAINLLKHDVDVIVHNRTKANAQPVIDHGALWAETPAALAAQTDVVITMLAHPEAVEATALDPETGFLDAMGEGALWADCSTVKPSFSRRMAAEAEKRGVRFLDAPVAGSKNQAEAAELVFIVGGDADDVAEMQPLFNAMGKATNHVGGHGMGISLKLVVNYQLAATMVAFAEGVHLGQSLGIPEDVLFNVLIGSVVVPGYMAGKRDRMASGDYAPEFPLQWIQKDVQMATDSAYETGAAMPMANLTKEIYRMAMQQGMSEDDFSAIYAFFNSDKA